MADVGTSQPGWYQRIKRIVPFIGYHHVLMMLLIVSTVLFSILLAGCTAENMRDFYLLSFSYTGSASTATDHTMTNPNASSLMTSLAGKETTIHIRVAYFGYCMINNGITSCSTNADSLATLIQEAGSSDPLNLLYVAKSFRDGTIFSGLIFISIILSSFCLCLLGTFPRWLHDSEVDSDGSDSSERGLLPFPSKRVSEVALILVSVASLFSLVAALWQHLSSAATSTMVGTLMYGTVSGHVGAGAMALGWAATAVLFVAMMGLLIMLLSIIVLNELADQT